MTLDSPSSARIRRNDLDALRGIAMVAGIVLHAAIAFMPGSELFWPVWDTRQSPGMPVLMQLIHGFRMPLFFLLSGFFTAMLWRKRGLGSLLAHRFKRIFIPLCLGVMILTPANFIAAAVLKNWISQSAEPVVGDVASDGKTVSKLPASVDEAWMAAANGDVNSIKQWIEAGNEVSTRTGDQSIPLHGATLFGRMETAELLVEAGSDLGAKNIHGSTPIAHLELDWGMTKSLASLLNVKVEQDQVMEGRKKIATYLRQEHAEAFASKMNDRGEISLTKPSPWAGVIGLLRFPIFGHLWFLYFLCLMVVGFAFTVSTGSLLGISSLPNWMTESLPKYLWIVPLAGLCQWMMGEPDTFGPSTSTSIWLNGWILAYYSVFFGFGAMFYCRAEFHGSDGKDGRPVATVVGKRWWLMGLAGILLIYPLHFFLISEDLMNAIGPIGHLGSSVAQTLYAWVMTFAAMGFFQRYCSTPSAWMRYLSDSSYWLYLAHLPTIFFVLYWVRQWDLSPWIKLPIVCVVTTMILLVTYHVFVRYTPIGWLLNGKRRKVSVAKNQVQTEQVGPVMLDGSD